MSAEQPNRVRRHREDDWDDRCLLLGGDDCGSLRPSAQRYAIATVRSSIQPSSCGRRTKAVVHWLQAEGVLAPMKLVVGIFKGCARGERPREGRAAEQRDEFAPFPLMEMHPRLHGQERMAGYRIAGYAQPRADKNRRRIIFSP